MQRIHQKIVQALFSALAVSLLLGACGSPTNSTPTSAPAPVPTSSGGNRVGNTSSGTPTPSVPTTMVKVRLQTISADVVGYDQVLAYKECSAVEVRIYETRACFGHFLFMAKAALAKEVASADGIPKDENKFKFFKDAAGKEDIDVDDLGSAGNNIIYVGKEQTPAFL